MHPCILFPLHTVPSARLKQADPIQLAQYVNEFYQESAENRAHFTGRPYAYNILCRVDAVKQFMTAHPYILNANGAPIAQVNTKAFYMACLGENEHSNNTINNHLNDYDRAHALKDKSATIRRVLAGENVPDVMQPWAKATAGKAPTAVTCTDFRKLLAWVTKTGADPSRGTM